MSDSRWIALGCLVVSGLLLAAGINVESGADAYRFPNALAVVMGLFALIMLVTARGEKGRSASLSGYVYSWLFRHAPPGHKKRGVTLPRLLPLFMVLLTYLALAERVGLYVTSFLAFLSIVILYGDGQARRHFVPRNMAIAILFIGSIYLLFSVALQLHTPQALLL